MTKLKTLPPALGHVAPCGLMRAPDAERRITPRDKRHAWYSSDRWFDLRLAVLKRAGFCCEQTGVGLVEGRKAWNAAVVDHIIPHNYDPVLFWDPANLQAVCKSWHDSEKQKQDHAFR